MTCSRTGSSAKAKKSSLVVGSFDEHMAQLYRLLATELGTDPTTAEEYAERFCRVFEIRLFVPFERVFPGMKQWVAAKKPGTDEPKLLHMSHVCAHLLGRYVINVERLVMSRLV